MEQRNRSGIAPLADSTCKGPHKSTLTDEVGGSRRRPLLLLRPFQSAGDLSTGSVRFNFFMQPRENRHQLWKWFILIDFHLKMILFILLVSSIQRSQLTHRLFAGQEIWIFKWNIFHWNQDTGIYYWKNFRHIRMIWWFYIEFQSFQSFQLTQIRVIRWAESSLRWHGGRVT